MNMIVPAPPLRHAATEQAPLVSRWLARSVMKPVTACDENIILATDSNFLKLLVLSNHVKQEEKKLCKKKKLQVKIKKICLFYRIF